MIFMEVYAIICAAFVAGVITKSILVKRKETAWKKLINKTKKDRYLFFNSWNVTSCHLDDIRRMVTLALENDQGGPYRSNISQLIETLELIRDKTEENLNGVYNEVSYFRSLEEASCYADKWDGNEYPIVIGHEKCDGICWHVIHDDEKKEEIKPTEIPPPGVRRMST